MRILKQWIYLILVLLAEVTNASLTLPGDIPYYRLRKGNTLYIYDVNSKDIVDQLIAYDQALQAMYEPSFNWKLDEEKDLILLSSHQQIANAYATVMPNLKTVWYPSGAMALEEMAESSWLLTLASHETAHLYQLNTKGKLNGAVKRLVGNSFVFYPFILPIFIHPNIFLPTFMLEGNAVLNESRLNLGGRLHSGEKRALVLAQIKEGLINPNRLINDGFEFPFGEESYMQGAYFQAHLAAKYGVAKTNQFFLKHGEHYFWPLILNKTFRAHFGESYNQEIREYVRGLEGLASKQKSCSGIPQINDLFVGPLNHDDTRIFFLTTSAKEPPKLYVFDKGTRKFLTNQLDLMMGKVFWQNSKPFTAAADQHDLRHIEYSLYGKGAKLDPKYRGQFVTDIRAGKTVALNAGTSWLDPQVLVNGETFDVAHSNPILDEQGHVYYFRQNGSERILYRDREPLIKIDGFYAKLMEVDKDGIIYFVSNTIYGSSLFQIKGKEVSRALKSDRVIEARLIDKNTFLVVEVGTKGHLVFVAPKESSNETPQVYQYAFQSESLVPKQPVDKVELAKEEKSYNSFTELRYSGMDLSLGWSSYSGLSTLAMPVFTDPMEYQQLALGFNISELKGDEVFAQYMFKKYLPDFYVQYLYEENNLKNIDAVKLRGYNQEVALGVLLPLWRWQRWDAQIAWAATYEKEDINNEETYGSLSKGILQYQLAPGLGFLPWRQLSLSVINHLETKTTSWTKKDNSSLVNLNYIHGFPKEFYTNFSGNYAWAETHDIEIDYDPSYFTMDLKIPRLTSHNEAYMVKNVGSLRLEVNKAFNTPAYFPRFPFGLNRVAPVVVAQGIFMDDDSMNSYPPSTFEWGYGADLELLLFHRFPARLRLLQAYDTRYPNKSEEEAKFNLKKEF